MIKVELWGARPGGRHGTVSTDLEMRLGELIGRYGAEAVAQVAVLRSGVMPVDPDDQEISDDQR